MFDIQNISDTGIVSTPSGGDNVNVSLGFQAPIDETNVKTENTLLFGLIPPYEYSKLDAYKFMFL